MGDVKEEDWQFNRIRYGRQGMARNTAVSAGSSANAVTGNIGVNLAQRVGTDKNFTKTVLKNNMRLSGGLAPLGKDRKPFLKHSINFKNVNGQRNYSHTFPSVKQLENQIKDKLDSSGPMSGLQIAQGSIAGFGATLGSITGLGLTGLGAALLGVKEGPSDPVTGKPTVQMIPLLSNAILKHKYDAVIAIKAAIKNNKIGDVGDAFELGGFSFVRKPGEYNFYGNLSAVGLSQEELHGLGAIARGFDPTTYDRENDTGQRILTYNGTAGYRLDGTHVDFTGKIAGAGIGTMESDTWRAMVMQNFNGNGALAKQWLDETAKHRNFFGRYDENQTKKLQAIFDRYTSSAYDAQTVGIRTATANAYNTFGSEDYDLAEELRDSAIYTPFANMKALDTEDPMAINTLNENREFDDVGMTIMPYANMKALDTEDPMAINTRTNLYSDMTALDTEDSMATSSTYFVKNPVLGTIAFPFANEDLSLTLATSAAKINPLNLESYNYRQTKKMSDKWENQRSDNYYIDRMQASYDETDDRWRNDLISVVFGSQVDDLDEDVWVSNAEGNINADEREKNQANVAAQQAAQDYIRGDFQKTLDSRGFSKMGRLGGNPSGGFNKGGRIGYQAGDVIQGSLQTPQVVGGKMPSQVPEQQTIADDQKDSLKEGTFVLNAPAVELAGERDVKNMVMDAFYSAKEKGLPIGRTDNRLYEKNVDVLLSKGEVTIPPELVKIIGLSKLRKLNNRGLREVEIRAAEAKEQQQKSKPQFRAGDVVGQGVPQSLVDQINEQTPPKPTNRDIIGGMLGKEQTNELFGGEEITVSELDSKMIQDGETEYQYKKRFGIIPSDMPEDEFNRGVAASGGTGFLNPPSDVPSDDIALQNVIKSMKVPPLTKINYSSSTGIEQYLPYKKYTKQSVDLVYDSLHFAEWGEGYDKPKFHLGDYFTRTHTEPEEGSSAYGPLQITGGLLVAYFGTDKQLEDFGNTGPAGEFKEAYGNAGGKKDGSAVARSILNNEEKVFVDAMIDQAHSFLIYGNRPKKEGYNPTYDYGGRGDIFEKFPNYKQLYKQVAHKLIELSLDKANGDLVKTAKIWKEGRVGSPKTTFKDQEYLNRFKQGVQGERVKNEQPEIPSTPVLKP